MKYQSALIAILPPASGVPGTCSSLTLVLRYMFTSPNCRVLLSTTSAVGRAQHGR